MANELEIINNPTSTPAAVSTGYQRQNTRAIAVSNGIDNTYVAATSATNVRLYESGSVDISGTLYAVGTQADFTVSSAGRYFIYLADGTDANHKTPTLGTDAGTFDAELNARYLSGGERVLNWLISKDMDGIIGLSISKFLHPSDTVGAVSTNEALMGVDNTYVEAYDATTVRLYQYGTVDISGVLYPILAQVDFTVSSAGRYFISLSSASNAVLDTDAGTFDSELNARYLSGGERVLNWLIVKETVGSTKLTVLRMTDPGKLAAHNEPLLLARVEVTSAGTTTWTAPRSQVYTFELQACGGDGGAGSVGDGSVLASGGGGGGGGYSKISEFIEAGTVLTLTRAIASGANCQITGTGFSTTTSQNGTVGGDSNGTSFTAGGAGGSGSVHNGQSGGWGGSDYFVFNPAVAQFGIGGSSHYGNGGAYINPNSGYGGEDGTGYGGGGCAGYANPAATPGGTGAPGLFMIWG